MPESMTCPRCDNSSLLPGVIVGRSPGVKFKLSKGFPGDLTGIPLTTGIFNHTAPARRCDACGVVVVLPER